MHHLYPLAKGDPLCPLGFHPQVRWPTRCKRCFRDYKEHGGKKRDDDSSLRRDAATASTPSLSWNSSDGESKRRSWVSSTNLATDKVTNSTSESDYSNPSSWTSTPDLANLQDDTQPITTVSIKLPKRKQKPIDTGQRTVSDSFSITNKEKSTIFNRGDNLATRAKKMQAIKESSDRGRRIQIKEVKTISEEPTNNDVKAKPKSDHSQDSSDNDDTISLAGTETTDTTLVDAQDSEFRDQLESMRKELEMTKLKCDRLEREKSDILLRRLAAMETTTSKTTATEVLKLQQKCNEMQQQLEDYKDDKRSLTLRVKELEADLELRPTAQQAQKVADELRSKLMAAETLCEELMDENEDIKKELRDMEEQMDELQDNFREDQAVEYTSLKKDLDQTTKNCRILSFKLRKAERKATQLEFEKAELEKKLKDISGSGTTLNQIDRIKQLEQELKVANEVSLRVQKELDEATQKLNKAEDTKTPANRKKAPLLGSIGKNPSADGKKVSRESLTRGGSQDDPAQLLRDLQDSLEREADLREQLKFAEEENNNTNHSSNGTGRENQSVLNKYTQTLYNNVTTATQTSVNISGRDSECKTYNQSTQTNEDNELRNNRNHFLASLQLRNLPMSKVYQPARTFSPMSTLLSIMGRKLSPTNQRLTPEPTEKEVSDDDDPAEVKLQLELSEQEASVLRKKVEELEADVHRLKNKNKELQEKYAAKTTSRRSLIGNDNGNSLSSQKLKVLEDETNDLRKKLIEKERDCERLHAELSLNQKRSKGMQKSKSLDLDQQTLDLKRQLQVIEQEAAVLRNKVQALESENEKLTAENKRLSLLRGTKNLKTEKNLDKYIDQIANLEIELAEKDQIIRDLEKALSSAGLNDKITDQKGDYKKFSQRTPKKVTALTSRDQLKTMVGDLEKEIGEMLVAIKTSENSKIKLEEEMKKMKAAVEMENALKDLELLNKKFDSVKKELDEEKSKADKESKANEELNKTLKKTKENLELANEEKKKLQDKVEKLNKEQLKLQEENQDLNDEISKLKVNLKSATSKQSEITALTQKADSLKQSLDAKEKEAQKLKTELEEKTKLANENAGRAQKISELETQLTKFENKYSEADKKLREQNKDFENKLDKEKQKIKVLEKDQTKWEEDRKKLNQQVEGLNTKIKGLENTIEQKNKLVKQLEDSLEKEREIVSKTNLKAGEHEKREISKLKDELSKSKVQLSELESKLEIANKSQKNLEDKLKKTELESKNTKLEHDKQNKELEINLQNERKKLEVLKTNNEKEQKNREMELAALKAKIRKLELSSGGGIKRELEIKQFQENIDKLESTIRRERQKYDDLTAKYEILEEEHVVTKAKLVMEKETLETQFKNLKREMDQLDGELKTLRDTYNTKQDIWIKEKLEMEQKLKEASRISYNGNDSDRQRLKALLEEKQSECEQIKKEYDSIHDQMDFMRRENDDLKKKLDDYEKVNKIQRNISADSSAMEKEMKHLRIRLNNAEKSKKSDLAELKMRYESQINVVNGELQSLQNQVVRFKREKDTYKHMLESAQKTIGDLKQSPKTSRRGSQNINYDEMEETKTKIATLEQQISCMEDELSEARLECSRLKTELVSERSSYEVKLSELHSRVNELEEEKVLNSGRTKIVGLRTRMELAWQKEREEQQRLLQETATLARDLRQTLFEVERERDKERLEAKRKQDLFKKTSEEDQDENKRKITELQCDLLELRDAHAKLRTTNEKLRREKERYEKERDEYRTAINGKKRSDQEDERKISALVEQVDTLKQLAPELFFSKDNEAPYTPTPPRRTKSKSRETSPALDKRETSLAPEEKQQQIQYIMQRLVHTTEELRRLQRLSEDEVERERLRRTMGMRRATSTEHENLYNKPYMRKASVSSHSSLKRKSLSLEHTTQAEQKIWTNDDSMSSLTSLELHSDVESGRGRRDASLDSRLSSGSTQSDLGEKKKKKGIMGKLKKLTKARSIDDQDPGTFSPTRSLSSKPNSNSDLEDNRGSKKDLKERITGIFKKAGSSSRSNSVERRHETSSTQRPLIRNGSNGHMSQSVDVDKPQKAKSKKS